MEKSKPKQSSPINEDEGILKKMIEETERQTQIIVKSQDQTLQKIKKLSQQIQSKQEQIQKLQNQYKNQSKRNVAIDENEKLKQHFTNLEYQLDDQQGEVNDKKFQIRLLEAERVSLQEKEKNTTILLQEARTYLTKKQFLEKDNLMVGNSRQKLNSLCGQYAEIQVDEMKLELKNIKNFLQSSSNALKNQRKQLEKLQKDREITANQLLSCQKKIETNKKSKNVANPEERLAKLKQQSLNIDYEMQLKKQQKQKLNQAKINYQAVSILLKKKLKIIQAGISKSQNDAQLENIELQLDKYILEVFNLKKKIKAPILSQKNLLTTKTSTTFVNQKSKYDKNRNP